MAGYINGKIDTLLSKQEDIMPTRYLFIYVKEEYYADPDSKKGFIPPPDFIGIIYADNYPDAYEKMKKHLPEGYRIGNIDVTPEVDFLIYLATNTTTLI